MRKHLLTVAAVATLFVTTGCASGRGAGTTSVLPLRTLRIYETGVGYFERTGKVPTPDESGLPVPAGHLDDALKTLVVLSPDGKARVDGVEFGSSLSRGMARAMAGLPQQENDAIDYEMLIASLKGSHVELRTPNGTHLGRLVEVDDVPMLPPPKGDDDKKKTDDDKSAPKPKALRLTLFTDAGAVIHVDGPDVLSVRPTDPAQAARIDAALAALLAHGAASHHELRILGDPGSPITLGYIAETPVWRTSYRVVLAKDSAILQGWALLHNDTDEDWSNLKVELVNGRPDSFLFPLAAPRYARRPLVTPEGELSTVPQLLGNTADRLWGDHVEDSEGYGGLGLSGIGEGGGGRGEGIGLGKIGTIGHGSGYGIGGPGTSSLLEVGDLAKVAQANGVEAGALFVYTMPSPVALRGHASALVPFLQQSIEAEPIAWFDTPGSVARSGLRFINSTSQTLPPGTLAIFSSGGFSGESAIDRMRPKERRFLTYGADLDVDAKQQVLTQTDEPQRLTFDHGMLRQHFLRTISSSWELENRSGSPRTFYVALSVGRNATVTGADAIDFDTESSRPLAQFKVGAGQKSNKTMKSVEGLSNGFVLTSLTTKQLTELSAAPSLAPADKAIATEASAKLKELEDLRQKIADAKADLETQEHELSRLREDAKSLGEKGPSAQPLVARMLAAEDKVAATKKKIDDLEKDDKAKFIVLTQTLEKLK